MGMPIMQRDSQTTNSNPIKTGGTALNEPVTMAFGSYTIGSPLQAKITEAQNMQFMGVPLWLIVVGVILVIIILYL